MNYDHNDGLAAGTEAMGDREAKEELDMQEFAIEEEQGMQAEPEQVWEMYTYYDPGIDDYAMEPMNM